CVVAVVCAGVVRVAAAADPETPLTLKEAIRIAQTHHPAVEEQQGQAVAAHGRSEQALSRLLPFLQANAAYQPTTPNLAITPAQARTFFFQATSTTVVDTTGAVVGVTCRTPGVGGCMQVQPSPTIWTPQNFWLAQLGVSWTVWDWGRSIYSYRGARDLAA